MPLNNYKQLQTCGTKTLAVNKLSVQEKSPGFLDDKNSQRKIINCFITVSNWTKISDFLDL